MAIIEGGVSGSLVGVGAEAASPLHTVTLPVSYGAGGYYRLGMSSGTIAAALGANSEIFQFRYATAASRIALIYKITMSAGLNVAATVAGLVNFRVTAARAWTAAGSGGTRATLTGDNCNLRTSMATSEVSDAGIASTGALTAGTKTLDASDIAALTMGIGIGAITTTVDLPILTETTIFDAGEECFHPLVLVNQEGFVIRTGANAFPASATWGFSVNVLWGEVPSF